MYIYIYRNKKKTKFVKEETKLKGKRRKPKK